MFVYVGVLVCVCRRACVALLYLLLIRKSAKF